MEKAKERLRQFAAKVLPKKERLTKERLIILSLMAVFGIAGIVALVNILSLQHEYTVAEKEYDELRTLAPESVVPADDGATQMADATNDGFTDADNMGLEGEYLEEEYLPEHNPDYIGWIRIDGTRIDYPVVQGTDNEKYLNTTFGGRRNVSGAIFMDYRLTERFEAPSTILYGHNMKNGSMFAGLHRFLDESFVAADPRIEIIFPDGTTRIYTVIAAKITDIHDRAYTMLGQDEQAIYDYTLSLDADRATGQMLLLSTCTDYNNDDERMLVVAAPGK